MIQAKVFKGSKRVAMAKWPVYSQSRRLRCFCVRRCVNRQMRLLNSLQTMAVAVDTFRDSEVALPAG